MVEPAIELSTLPHERAAGRQSVDSLQRDIADAIRVAQQPDHIHSNRNSATGSTMATLTSANSLITGHSYLDFDADSSRKLGARNWRRGHRKVTHKVRKLQQNVLAQSVGTGSRLVRPLKLLRRPFIAVKEWWARRNLLPPSPNGRKIKISILHDASQDTVPEPELVRPAESTHKGLLGWLSKSNTPTGPVSEWDIDVRTGKPYCTNLVTSSIYTVHDFVPRQLLAQFSKLANVYFLFVAILQMIPGWSSTGNYTTIVPLCVFVMISMSREGYEDWERHRNDAEENNRQVLVREGTGYKTCRWQDVKVGDVVRVLQNEWFPADVVLLHSSGPKGQCSIETLALDGESNLKSKEVPPAVQRTFRADGPGGQALVTVEDPNMDLFNFEGTIELENEESSAPPPKNSVRVTVSGESDAQHLTQNQPSSSADPELEFSSQLIPLSNSNIVYRGCTLRNTASVSGVVVYSGKETKMQLNATKGSRIKAPKLQSKVNRVVIALAALVVLLSGILTGVASKLQDTHPYWYLQGLHVTITENMMGFIIMLNTLIPISLYVSMEICKVFQTFLMQNDIDMYDEVNDVRCSVQSSSLNEELGQVSYVFSDKTGTLTDNVMLFRKMSVGGHAWTHDLDLYLGEDEGYLFHQARPNTDMEVELLEQLSKLPRKSFGGRIGGSRPSMARQSLGRPSIGRPSMGKSSMGRPSMGGRFSMGAPARLARASAAGRVSAAGRPSAASKTLQRPSAASAVPSTPIPNLSIDGSAAGSVREAALGWQSSAVPNKQQMTPSTLTLLEYMMANPHSPYSERARFFLFSLALCHSASPVVDLTEASTGEVEIEQLDYQASSPDELALVSAARDLGFLVVDRQTDSITVRTYPNGLNSEPCDEVYKILDVIEFTSSRKRMSVIVERPDGRILLLCKGADNVMIERLQKQLLSTAHAKQDSLYDDATLRRSVEAQLANENRTFARGVRPSLDMLLQRSSADHTIHETARRSAQMHRRSVELRQNIKNSDNTRNSIQSAIADARMTATENAMETRMSLERSSIRSELRNPEIRSPTKSPERENSRHLTGESRSRTSFDRGNRINIGRGDRRSTHADLLTDSPRFSTDSVLMPPPTPGTAPNTAGNDAGDMMDERQALERTLEHIDEFSTEGLRTLLYGHRFLSKSEYSVWKSKYDAARSAISNRQAKLDAVGEEIEHELEVTGASAIEDKLQKGVPEAIDKLRRANIRMWMLTGDKRETAVNIGYSCRLIKDFSTVITLKIEDNLEEKLMAALEELETNSIAHCVVVIDGLTLAQVEKNAIYLSLFVDLGLKADSVIVCRASPAQKANIVKCVRKREPKKVMLAIGDGANDIAMIQAADVGIGIAGREGLQAARSSDFSIGQFRFLLKLLLVHGRWNYVRTCKYILATFYKEFFFYMSQVVYQRYTMFTGTSVFESWSIAMFNTLFTSLPVINLGVMDQDLSPTTLIAVPELYNIGQQNRKFHFRILLGWLIVATLECVMVGFVTYTLYGSQSLIKDTTIFPFGVLIYTSVVVIVNVKTQFVTMMYYITLFSFLTAIISCGGYWLFNILIGLVYIIDPSKTYFAEREFWTQTGTELAYWATAFLAIVIAILFELSLKMASYMYWPTDVDEFQAMEKDPFIMRRLEAEAELELSQGWEYQDQLDHSWLAIFRGKWPGQPRHPVQIESQTTKRRPRDIIAEKLRLRKPVDYDREIQEILERRQRETEMA